MSSSRSAARLACRAMRASRNSVHTNSCASTSRRAPHCEPARPSQNSATPRMRVNEEAKRSYTSNRCEQIEFTSWRIHSHQCRIKRSLSDGGSLQPLASNTHIVLQLHFEVMVCLKCSAASIRRPLMSQLPAALRLALARQSSLLLFNWDGEHEVTTQSIHYI